MKKCKKCEKELVGRQKAFCSRACQGNGSTKKMDEKICLNCGNTSLVQISQRKNFKYCNRRCKDGHLKTKFLGEKNPSFGRAQSIEEKEKRSNSQKKSFENNPDRKEIFAKTKKRYFIEQGCHLGHDENSKEKKRQTYMKNFGVSHNWSSKKNREKCEKTCFEKTGMYSWQIALKSNKKKVQILK